jgi:hypothetical protein
MFHREDFFSLPVLVMESRVLCMLDKCSAIERRAFGSWDREK